MVSSPLTLRKRIFCKYFVVVRITELYASSPSGTTSVSQRLPPVLDESPQLAKRVNGSGVDIYDIGTVSCQ